MGITCCKDERLTSVFSVPTEEEPLNRNSHLFTIQEEFCEGSEVSETSRPFSTNEQPNSYLLVVGVTK